MEKGEVLLRAAGEAAARAAALSAQFAPNDLERAKGAVRTAVGATVHILFEVFEFKLKGDNHG